MLRFAPLLLLAGAFLHAQQAGKGLVIVLIGPPGSGKTTQAGFLAARYEIPVITGDQNLSGDEFRRIVKAVNASRGFIIDGYPATRKQADNLAAVVRDLKLPNPIVLHLDVPDDVARQRLAGKEKPAALDSRLAQYHQEMDFIRSYYPQADIWTVIGTRSEKDVFKTIVSLVQDRIPDRH
ncbi:MAG: nucleoside monophosphate kinase [Candidatus Solibacter usitatus]|nr:nucleoside monophosphate kinase [Candidatus Solibacter usitatus]